MPVITLATDIGQSDFQVAAIKGQLLSCNASFQLVDITHQLSSNHLLQSAYICNSAYGYFPPSAYHLVVVNLYHHTPSQFLMAPYRDGYIACPDNGILPLIDGVDLSQVIAIRLDSDKTLLNITQTIAIAFTRLSEGESLLALGEVATDIHHINKLPESNNPDRLEAHIIFVDKYENVVINLSKTVFEERRNGMKFQIIIKRNDIIDTISDSYAAVPEGEKLAWFNSAGYLELGMNKGNMASLFGLKSFKESGNSKDISNADKSYYHTIRINFFD